MFHRLVDGGMIDGDDRQRVGPFAQVPDAGGDPRRHQFVDEFEDRLAVDRLAILDRLHEFRPERLIERILALLQQQAKRLPRHFGEPPLQQSGGVIAYGFCRIYHANCRVFADRKPPVQHPVHGGNTDPCALREVGNGGTLDHGFADSGCSGPLLTHDRK